MEVLIIQGINALIRRRLFIIAMTCALGFVGLLRGAIWTTYEADVLLLLTPLGATGDGAKLLSQAYPSKVYTSLLLSPQTVGETMKRLEAQGFFKEEKEPLLSEFRDQLSVNVETVDATTRPVSYSPLVKLQVTADSPEHASAIAKAWSEVAIEQSNKMLALPIAAAFETLNAQKVASETKLAAIWKEMSAEKAQYNVELMQSLAELQLKRIDALETQYQTTTRELNGFEKSLESVTKTLAEEKPFHELARAPSETTYWLSQIGGAGEKTMKDLTSKVMVSQEINSVYWDTKAREGQLTADIAGKRAQIAAIEDSLAKDREENKKLQSQLGEHLVIQRDLESQELVAKSVYEDVAKASAVNETTLGMIQAKDEKSLRPIGLNQVSDDVYTIKFVSIFSGRRAAFFGAILGFLLSACAVLIRDVGVPWWRTMAVRFGVAS